MSTAVSPSSPSPAPSRIQLSALVVVRNEQARIAACLERLAFADEIVVVLDRSTDATETIAHRFTDRVFEGAWEREGDRRNTGIGHCRGAWILEVDADELVSDALAAEIRAVIAEDRYDIFNVPNANHVGGRLVRHGWMAAIGTAAVPRLFRRGVKHWGPERVHPHLTVTGRQGPDLRHTMHHNLASGISDLLHKLDRNTTWRALDLIDKNEVGSMATAVRRIASRFWKCYVARRGYRENGYGLIIALCAALYPVLSHLKARLDLADQSGPVQP